MLMLGSIVLKYAPEYGDIKSSIFIRTASSREDTRMAWKKEYEKFN